MRKRTVKVLPFELSKKPKPIERQLANSIVRIAKFPSGPRAYTGQPSDIYSYTDADRHIQKGPLLTAPSPQG